MKALVYSQYGSPDVLRLADVKKPAAAEAVRHLGAGLVRGKVVITMEHNGATEA